MGHTPRTLSCCRRFCIPVILILCLACIALSADAASTRGLPTTTPTTPAFQLQQTIALATPTPQTISCPVGCECMERSRAIAAWGTDGFTQCAEKACGYSYTAAGLPIEKYCLKQKAATVPAVIGVRPQVTLTYLQTANIPPVTTTTKIPVHMVTINPSGICSGDTDCDGRPDASDNCPAVANTQQLDSDSSILWSTCTGTLCKMPAASDLMNCEGSPGDPLYENCMKAAWLKANPGGSCLSSLNCQHKTDNYGDACDNCWEKLNPDQADSDGDCAILKQNSTLWDGTKWLQDPQCGDACDKCPNFDNTIDSDHDGVPDGCDTCWNVPNADQKDSDQDCSALKQDPSFWDPVKKIWLKDPQCGDACDNCKSVFNPDQKDSNSNNIGDACDCSDRVIGPYEMGTDCGVASADAVIPKLNIQGDTSTALSVVKTEIANSLTGCPNQPCSPCGTFNGNFSWTNWRGFNWMTPPTDQGKCGSCWVHSPIAVVEAMYRIHSGKAIGGNQWDFLGDTVPKVDMNVPGKSPTRLYYPVVVNNADGDKCGGGHNNDAMSWIYDNGVPDFAYVHHYRIAGWNSVQTDCCGGLMGAQLQAAQSGNLIIQYLTCQGPLSVCTPHWNGDHGHCFTLVGYDQSKFGGTGGWLIKNNWGDDWPAPYPGNPDDYQFDRIPGLGGYAYLPVQQGFYGADYMAGTWSKRWMLFTSYVYEG
jgi:hypothetical protein